MNLGKDQIIKTGEEQLMNFVLEHVHDEHKEGVKELMNQNFQKQADGTLTHEDLKSTQSSLMQMLKPEMMEQAQSLMSHFTPQTGNK